jgi:hypothetical protein
LTLLVETRGGSTPKSTIPRFTGPKPGAKGIPPWVKAEVDIFKLLLDNTIVFKFIENTNKYGAHYYGDKWLGDIGVADFMKYIAISLALGIMCPPNRRDAWSI